MAKTVDDVEIKKVRKISRILVAVWAVLGLFCVGAEGAMSPWRWVLIRLFVCSMVATVGYVVFRWAPAEDEYFARRFENKRSS